MILKEIIGISHSEWCPQKGSVRLTQFVALLYRSSTFGFTTDNIEYSGVLSEIILPEFVI